MQVRGFLERLCRKLQDLVPPSFRDHLQPEAIESILVEKISGFREKEGRFDSWCKVVLKNHFVDLARRSHDALDHPGTIRVEQEAGFESTWVEKSHRHSPEAFLDLLHSELQSIRQMLDDLSADVTAAQRVDYHAVLLVQLRWVLFERLHRCFPDRERLALEMNTFSSLIEVCLPWHGSECDRRFRPGWPTLGAIWQGVSQEIERSDSFTFDMFQSLLESLSRETRGLTPDLWRHWVKRAKESARRRIGWCEWDRVFGHWLLDRRGQTESNLNETEVK
jgi:hypothetical protein